MLLVGVVELLQASGALGSVRVLKAAVQAVVPHPVAIAIARLLMEHGGNLRRQFVSMRLIGILRIGAPKIRLGEGRRQLGALRRRSGVVGWNPSLFLGCGPFR